MSSRKRHHDEDDEEEEGQVDSLSDDDQHGHSRSKSKKSKKSKKHKKEKKRKKKRHRSDTPEVEDGGEISTDKEAGSTPEIEAGEVVSDEGELVEESRERTKKSKKRSRSPSEKRRHRRSDASSSRLRSRSGSPRQRKPADPDSGSGSSSALQAIKRKLKRPSPPPPPPPAISEKTPEPAPTSGHVESLSIEETNKLRASLGLAPLKTGKARPDASKDAVSTSADKPADDGVEGTAIPDSDVRHKPAENLTEKSATEKMRERLNQRRTKRQQEAKLLTTKSLGVDDSVDDTAKWLAKQKRKQRDKQEAERRAKLLEDLDNEFGVGNLVKEDAEKEKSHRYDAGNLAGLKVEHAASRFDDGRNVILTLKDADVLDESAGDTLVNVNMLDDERVEKARDDAKKAKTGGYSAYDNDEMDVETGEFRRKNLLDKYDEEIDGERKTSFEIGRNGTYDEEREKAKVREKLRLKFAASKTVESLDTPALRVASDYYTEEEAAGKFRKPKKAKKKVKRKMLKADDLLPVEGVATSRSEGRERPMEVNDDVKPDIDASDVKPVVADSDDIDLQMALRKARRLKQRQRVKEEDFLEKNGLGAVKDEPEDEEITSTGAEFINTFADDTPSANIILNETSEFCRNLGAWRSHEASGLGESVSRDILDFEQSLSKSKSRPKYNDDDSDDDDSNVEMETDVAKEDVEISAKSSTILDEEPDLQSGMAAAIKLATNKGYWETEEKAAGTGKLKHLQAKNYSIDDKNRGGDDDRHSRRGGDRYGGSSQPFQEKSGYTPNVKLEYADESGRLLNQKEAFRYLSHRFHGKGSGKVKTEKRMKKIMEESMMKNMSSTDTPLQTLDKLKQRHKEGATPYVVLTGNKVQATDLRK